jgi:hypothetical protein
MSTEAEIAEAAERGQALADRLYKKYPTVKVSFGYIGTLERWGDAREWRFFTELPAVNDGFYTNKPSWGRYYNNSTQDLPSFVERAERELEDWVVSQIVRDKK